MRSMTIVRGISISILLLWLLLPSVNASINSVITPSENGVTQNTIFTITLEDPAGVTAQFHVEDVNTSTVVPLTDLPLTGKHTVFGSFLPHIAQPPECSKITDPSKCVESGYRYIFTFSKGSETNQTAVLVDTSLPSCSFVNLPAITSSPFQLQWTGTDDLSSVVSYILERSIDGTAFVDFFTSTQTTATFSFEDGTYSIRCRSIDAANNSGNPSPAQTIIIDTEPPNVSFHQLQEITGTHSPAYRTDGLNMSWNATDISGIACYALSWSTDNITFTNITKNGNFCLTTTSEVVGDETGEPLPQAGGTFYFKLAAYDHAGIRSDYSYTSTTVDTSAPSLDVTKRLGSQVVEDDVLLSDKTSSVTVEITVHDDGSPIKSAQILSRGFPGVGDFFAFTCTTFPCSQTFTLLPIGSKELEVKAVAEDIAGNRNESSSFFVLRKPLIKLPAERYALVLGKKDTIELSIRNTLKKADTITLDLCGTGLIRTCPSYVKPEITHGPTGSVIYNNGLSLNVTLPPLTADTVTVLLEPSDLFAGDSILAYGASDESPNLKHVDAMQVSVDFPPEFPDLSLIGMVVLFLLSGIVMWNRE